METVNGESATFRELKDLKSLLASEGPCISIYMNLGGGNGKQNELQWKELTRALSERAQRSGAAALDMLDSLTWDSVAADVEGANARAIAVFRSNDQSATLLLDEPVRERTEVGPHFYIRPLLAQLTRPTAFYLLALSQKNVRLLRCTSHSSEAVEFPSSIPLSFDAYMNTAKPDHNTENRASAGPGSGSSKGVMSTTSSDREDHNEFLAHFFRQIDRGVNEVLKGHSEPLVLCAVEYEQPLYREVNSYAKLAATTVHGAPNSLKSGEMHARALEALQTEYNNQIDTTLAEWNHKVGSAASSRLKEVVTAAHEGRVLTLVVSDSQEKFGAFEEETHKVIGRETGTRNDEDLVNDAVVQTILHAGNVVVAPHSKLPNGQPMAAVFRYQVASA